MRDAHKSIRVSFLDPCPWPWAHPQTLGPCEHRLPTTRPNPACKYVAAREKQNASEAQKMLRYTQPA